MTAGCPQVTLAAAALAGVDEVYRVGGAQAIAALAYGTESIPAVDVIVGPGNVFVSVAKREVAGAGIVGIESPAGPSELVVVADRARTAEPRRVGPRRAGRARARAAPRSSSPGSSRSPTRWTRRSRAIVADAPRRDEMADDARRWRPGRPRPRRRARRWRSRTSSRPSTSRSSPKTRTRCCRWSATRARCSSAPTRRPHSATTPPGANHVLPTGRSARFASALRVDDFRKHVHVVRATPEGFGGAQSRRRGHRPRRGPRRARALARPPGEPVTVRRPRRARATTSARSRATTRRSSTSPSGSTPTRARSRPRRSSSTRGSASSRRPRCTATRTGPRAELRAAIGDVDRTTAESGCSAPTDRTRCSRRCCSPTAARVGGCSCSSRRTRSTATSPASPAPRSWSARVATTSASTRTRRVR